MNCLLRGVWFNLLQKSTCYYGIQNFVTRHLVNKTAICLSWLSVPSVRVCYICNTVITHKSLENSKRIFDLFVNCNLWIRIFKRSLIISESLMLTRQWKNQNWISVWGKKCDSKAQKIEFLLYRRQPFLLKNVFKYEDKFSELSLPNFWACLHKVMLLQACNIAVFENDSHVEKRRLFFGEKSNKKKRKNHDIKLVNRWWQNWMHFFAWNIHKASWEEKWSQNTVSTFFFSGIRFRHKREYCTST